MKNNTNNKTNEVKQGRKPFEIPSGIKVDWNTPNSHIAQQLGVSILTVMKLRSRLGKKPLPRGRPYETTTVSASALKDALSMVAEFKEKATTLGEEFQSFKETAEDVIEKLQRQVKA